MDIDGLRKEMEEHLKNNPDPDAPQGFRDRFEATVALLQSDDDKCQDSALEAQLQQIRNEAEIAAKAAGNAGEDDGPDRVPAPRGERPESPLPSDPGDPEREVSQPDLPPAERDHGAGELDHGAIEPGALRRFGLPLLIAVIVLAAAWFIYQR